MVKRCEKERVRVSDSHSLPSRLVEDEAPNPGSLSERIGVSTRGLLRSAVSQPSPGAAVDVLASTASLSEKGGSSSDSTRSIVSSEAFGSRPASTSSNQSWRSAADDHVYSHAGGAPEVYGFTTFVENSAIGSRGHMLDIDCGDYERNGKSKHEQDPNQFLEHTMRPLPNHGRAVPDIDKVDMMPTEALEYQRAGHDLGHDEALHSLDGAEVVRLLSDPEFCLDDMPLDVLHGAEVSRQEHEAVSHVAFPRSVSNSDAIANHLQLIPGSGVHPVILEKMAATMPRVDEYAQDLDLQPWLHILNSYHDEVWGDMLPLVRQVREEIGQSDNKRKVQDKPATRRLQMLIGHLKH